MCVLLKEKSLCHVWKKNIVRVSLGEKLQTVSVTDVSLLTGTSSTLSQLIEHGGPEELLEM